MRTTLLLVGHGSRDAAANAELEAFVDTYRARRPWWRIVHGYVELADPPLSAALRDAARGSDRVVALPLFLFAAGHVKHDLPRALDDARRELPGVRFTAARALGVHPTLAEIAFSRARAAIEPDPRGTALVVVGRGSSDPDANGDLCKLARLVGEGRDLGWVIPCFIGVTRPLFEETIELVARAWPDRIVVAPYFLFAGRLIARLRAQVDAFRARRPSTRVELAPHLGGDERLFALIDERLREAT